jgi:hypothetical protein
MHIATKTSLAEEQQLMSAKAHIDARLREVEKEKAKPAKTLVSALCQLRDALGETACQVSIRHGLRSSLLSDFFSIHDKDVEHIPSLDIIENTQSFKTSGFHHCHISVDDNVLFHKVVGLLKDIMINHKFQVSYTGGWSWKDKLCMTRFDLFVCEKESKTLTESEFSEFMKNTVSKIPTVDDWRVRQDIMVYAQRKLDLVIQADTGGMQYGWNGNVFNIVSYYSNDNTKRIFAKLAEIFSDKTIHIDGKTLTVSMV